MIEIRASFSRNVQLFVITALLAGLAGVATFLSWQDVEAGGLLLTVMIAALAVLAFVTYRMFVRPVMYRLDENGIQIKRLGLTVPWEALSHVEEVYFQGQTLFSLVERADGHEIFRDRRIQSGAAMNDRLGLPALVISMSGMMMEPAEFARLLDASDVVQYVGPLSGELSAA